MGPSELVDAFPAVKMLLLNALDMCLTSMRAVFTFMTFLLCIPEACVDHIELLGAWGGQFLSAPEFPHVVTTFSLIAASPKCSECGEQPQH